MKLALGHPVTGVGVSFQYVTAPRSAEESPRDDVAHAYAKGLISRPPSRAQDYMYAEQMNGAATRFLHRSWFNGVTKSSSRFGQGRRPKPLLCGTLSRRIVPWQCRRGTRLCLLSLAEIFPFEGSYGAAAFKSAVSRLYLLVVRHGGEFMIQL